MAVSFPGGPLAAARVTRVSVQEWLDHPSPPPLADVRTPAEYAHGHIPGARNIPLFSDLERAEIGTIYHRQSQGEAVARGLDLVEPKLDTYVEESRALAPEGVVAVHCWRGGMRSQAFAAHLAERGFTRVLVLEGGYKAWRRLIQDRMDTSRNLLVLGGASGSGKTAMLANLAALGEQVLDLEALATHRGSAFGAIQGCDQPTSEQFGNLVGLALLRSDHARPLWVEDESSTIGTVSLPEALFRHMREAPLVLLEVPRPRRLAALVGDYGKEARADLATAIGRISRRLGGDVAGTALAALEVGDLARVASLCLDYYDKAYRRTLASRSPARIHPLPLDLSPSLVAAREVLAFQRRVLPHPATHVPCPKEAPP